jgi:hypothetical protein
MGIFIYLLYRKILKNAFELRQGEKKFDLMPKMFIVKTLFILQHYYKFQEK